MATTTNARADRKRRDEKIDHIIKIAETCRKSGTKLTTGAFAKRAKTSHETVRSALKDAGLMYVLDEWAPGL